MANPKSKNNRILNQIHDLKRYEALMPFRRGALVAQYCGAGGELQKVADEMGVTAQTAGQYEMIQYVFGSNPSRYAYIGVSKLGLLARTMTPQALVDEVKETLTVSGRPVGDYTAKELRHEIARVRRRLEQR